MEQHESDELLPWAELPVIDAGRLYLNDAEEVQHLVNACCQYAVFYLQLNSTSDGSQVLQAEGGVLQFMEEYFGQPLEMKIRDASGNDTEG
jgi:hypothetical protein